MRAVISLWCVLLVGVAGGCGDVDPVSTAQGLQPSNQELFEFDFEFDFDNSCCMDPTAACLACTAGKSVTAYCMEHPFTLGCPDVAPIGFGHNCQSFEVWTPVKRAWCCEHEAVGCVSEGEPCALGGSPYFPAIPCESGLVCMEPEPEGSAFDGYGSEGVCLNPEPGCCQEPTLECAACAGGQSVDEYCEDHAWIPECEEEGRSQDSSLECDTPEELTLDQRIFCCEEEGTACASEGEACSTEETRTAPMLSCEAGLVCRVLEAGIPELYLPNRGVCEALIQE